MFAFASSFVLFFLLFLPLSNVHECKFSLGDNITFKYQNKGEPLWRQNEDDWKTAVIPVLHFTVGCKMSIFGSITDMKWNRNLILRDILSFDTVLTELRWIKPLRAFLKDIFVCDTVVFISCLAFSKFYYSHRANTHILVSLITSSSFIMFSLWLSAH